MLNIPLELLQKYNVQGPRYTSYPPAPSWTSDFGPSDYEATLSASSQTEKPFPLSLYFHLPFCQQLCYFCGCTTVITGHDRRKEDPYLESLIKEVNWVAARVGTARPVVQLHLGGGTPTYFSPEKLSRFMEKVHSLFSIDSAAEMGVEVDPRVTTLEHLEALRGQGFNRISMGVQDFDPLVQKSINRNQPFEMTQKLVDAARALGFESINIDLIYGLPHQTEKSFEITIQKVLILNPDRLAVYSYAHVPWMKTHQDVIAPHLPGEKEKLNIFLLAMKMFSSAGFEYIGMDHFAKPGDEMARARADRTLWRNFQGYTTKAGTDLLGLGMSAISHIYGSYFQNERELMAYQKAIQAGAAATVRGFKLNADDKLRSRVIQNLMCHAVVMKPEIEREFGINFDEYFKEALEGLKQLEQDGLVQLSKHEIRPTDIGRVFLRNLAMPFDAYLPKPGEKKVFSKTV
ncbi:MAG: Oxygen-independent coproporphyrinogen III oxidase [Elusimicrobia bacterium]|nr:Oxygen-independent coproporphyrinogen III oxidase [Elusimicrobiota bacterium]